MKTLFAFVAVAGMTALLPHVTRAVTATGLSSFEGIEEPLVRYAPASAAFVRDSFVNITDVGEGTFRMQLRYSSDEWDGDRDTRNKDRQRAEVKGLGSHQKHGDTFEYATTWRSNPSFQGANRFCHIFQLKATDGDSGAPLVTVSIHAGTKLASVQYWPGPSKSSITVREFAWKPGVWLTIRLRIKTSLTKDGEVLASIDGDEFQGVRQVAVYRNDSTDYRPKWGLYRGVTTGLALGDDFIEHKNVSANKVGAPSSTDETRLESTARTFAQTSPMKALIWIQSQPSSTDRAIARDTIVGFWAESEPAEAMAFVEKISSDDGRGDAMLRVFNRWADRDAAAALGWLQAHAPSAELDSLIWYFATDTTLRYVDRAKALAGAPLIANADLRARAIEHVVLIWAREDSTKAAHYIEESSALDAEQKKMILHKFPSHVAHDS